MNTINSIGQYKFTCKDRFLKYVKYDTQSDPNSKTFPSTEKQLVLLKELMSELKELGIKTEMDKYGYVYAHIKSNSHKEIPAIGFIAHVDTSPEVSGENVKTIIHQNYSGGDIILPKDNQIIRLSDNPELSQMKGQDIITADGSTLLGSDDKAGIACIMDAVNYLSTHPEMKHGDICIAFTMDEEIGRGLEDFDIKKFGAKYAYTLDGSSAGEIESETFNANKIIIQIKGRGTHAGYAKNKMINATKIASEFINSLPKDKWSPETTEGMEGFVHVESIEGGLDACQVVILIRDFDEEKLEEHENELKKLMDKIISKYTGAKYHVNVTEQYRNMKGIIDKHPRVMEYAITAMKNIGLKPHVVAVRGGTDGCKLSYMGIPTPNIFCGEHNFHSKTEWVSVQEMELSVRTIVEICKVWEGKS